MLHCLLLLTLRPVETVRSSKFTRPSKIADGPVLTFNAHDSQDLGDKAKDAYKDAKGAVKDVAGSVKGAAKDAKDEVKGGASEA